MSRKEAEELTGAAARTANNDLTGLVRANALRFAADGRCACPRRAAAPVGELRGLTSGSSVNFGI